MTDNSAYQPQFRTKIGALLLAFFLGDFGCHWFYLGERSRGASYPMGYTFCWLLCIIGSRSFLGPLGLIGMAVLFLSRVWDFFYLLAMHQTEFDYKYNT